MYYRLFLQSLILLLIPSLTFANQSIPLDAETRVITAANGSQLIYIASPNEHHISHNIYSQFNVPKEGTVFVNSNQAVQSKLVGLIEGNTHLSDFAAGLIINEVSQPNASKLLGPLEVAGLAANVVIANPYGIYCNGCRFENIAHASLITGKPQFDEGGKLQSYIVSGGRVTIDESGLDASESKNLTILTRSLGLYGPLYANDLQLVVGSHQMDIATNKPNVITATDTEPLSQAIDVKNLGGMYANKIKLIGPEASLAFHYSGVLKSKQEIVIDHQGDVRLGSEIDVPMLVINGKNIDTSNKLNGQRISIDAQGSITHIGKIRADQLILKAAGNIVQTGHIEAGELSVDTNQFIHKGSTEIGWQGNVKASYLENHGSLTSAGNLQLYISHLRNRNFIKAKQLTFNDANATIANHGRIEVSEYLKMYGYQFYNNSDLLVSGNAYFGLTHNFSNDYGNVWVKEDIVIEGPSLGSRTHIYYNNMGLVQAGKNGLIRADSFKNMGYQINENDIIRDRWIEYSGAQFVKRLDGHYPQNYDVEASNFAHRHGHLLRQFVRPEGHELLLPGVGGLAEILSTPSSRNGARYIIRQDGSKTPILPSKNNLANIIAMFSSRTSLPGLFRHNSHIAHGLPEAQLTASLMAERLAPHVQLKPAKTIMGGNLHIDTNTIENSVSFIVAGEQMHLNGNNLFNHGRTLNKHTTMVLQPWLSRDGTLYPTVQQFYPEAQQIIPSIIAAKGGIYGSLAGKIQNGINDVPSTLLNSQAIQQRLSGSAISIFGERPLALPNFDQVEANRLTFLKSFGFLSLRQGEDSIQEVRLLLPDRQEPTILPPFASFIWAPIIDLHAGQIDNAGGIFAKLALQLRASNIHQTGGEISSSGSVIVKAGQDIRVMGGSIRGQDIYLAADRDIHIATGKIGIQTLTLPFHHLSTPLHEERANPGTAIVAEKDITLISDGNAHLIGAQLHAGQILMISAGKDIRLDAQNVKQSSGFQEANYQTVTYSQISFPTQISGNQAVTVNAGQNIGTQGTDIQSYGKINIQAGGDIVLGASVNESRTITHQSETKRTGLFRRKETKDVYTQTDHYHEKGTELRGNQINIGGGGDVRLSGTDMVADDKVDITAGQHLYLGTRVDGKKQHIVEQKDSPRFFGRKNSRVEHKEGHHTETGSFISANELAVTANQHILSEGMTGITRYDIGFTAGQDMSFRPVKASREAQHHHQSKETGITRQGIGRFEEKHNQNQALLTQQPSLLGSQLGSIRLTSQGSIVLQATDLIAGQSIEITAHSIAFTPAIQKQKVSDFHEHNKQGVFVSLGGTAVNAFNALDSAIKTSRDGDKEKSNLYALKAAAIAANALYSGQNPQASQTQMGEDTDTATQANGGSHVIKVGVGFGQKSGKSEHHETQEIPIVSHATAQQTLTLKTSEDYPNAKTNAQDVGFIYLEGAQLSAYQIILQAANEIRLESAEETKTVQSKNKHSSGSVGIGVGLGGNQNGFTLDLAASRANGRENGESVTHHDTTLNAKTISIKARGDVSLKGTQVRGKRIEVEAKNLHIESLQDKDSYHQEQQQIGGAASICVPPYCSGQSSASMSYQRGYMDNDYQSVKVASGFYAGMEGFSVNVKGHTKLIGGALISEALPNKNTLNTGTLESHDIKNVAQYQADSSGISISSSMASNDKGHYFNPQKDAVTSLKDTVASNMLSGEDHYAESETKSIVSAGIVTITDEKGQLEKTGKTRQETIQTLNRDVNNSHQALDNTFDADKIKRTQELNQIKSDIVQQAAPIIFDQIGDYLQDQSPATKAAVHGIIGGALNAALGGDVKAGIVAGALTSLAVDYVDAALKDTDLSKESREAILQVTSAVIGKMSGTALKDSQAGNMAAFTAMEATEYNYLSHEQLRHFNKAIDQCPDFLCKSATTAKWLGISGAQDIAFMNGLLMSAPGLVVEMGEGITHIVTHPQETYTALKTFIESDDALAKLGHAVKESVIQDLDKAHGALQRAGVDGAYEAGLEYGKILGSVGSTVLGGAGLVKAGFQTTAKVADYVGKIIPSTTKTTIVLAETSPANAHSALNHLNLQKSLASEQQLAGMSNGKFVDIAGRGTDTPIRDITRLTSTYGGKPNDWSKVSSFKYRAADGSTLEIHAYRNVITGKIVEAKTIIGKGIK